MVQDRRLAVLGAIVRDYVQTSEPVGSKALVERHSLGVSAATIRNDMAALEEEGLIVAPHTSAGRVPTDAGYRLFVDRLSTIKPMSRAERAAIDKFLHEAVDLDDVVDRSVRLLASLTSQVAVMQYPSLTRSSVRHIELVPLGGPRLMLVLITTTGRVEQRVLDVGLDVEDGAVAACLRSALNTATAGRRLSETATVLAGVPESFPVAERDAVRTVIGALDEAMAEEREERVTMAGTANLVRHPSDFPASIEPVLDALEQQMVLLRLLSTAAQGGEHIAVRIGQENPVSELQSTSLVTTGYGHGSELLGALGVVGPTRMDYPASMAAVRTVAAYVSALLGQ